MTAGLIFNPSTLKLQFDEDNDKLMEIAYEFGNDCCCFLDPNNPDWDCETIYNEGDIAELRGSCAYYSGSVNYAIGACVGYYTGSPWTHRHYCSLQNDNLGHTPETEDTEWWAVAGNNPVYGIHRSKADNNKGNIPLTGEWWLLISPLNSCGNANWDAYPPYGGIDKTPKYIKVKFNGITKPDAAVWPQYPPGPNREFILPQISRCYYQCDEWVNEFVSGHLFKGKYTVKADLHASRVTIRMVWCAVIWEEGYNYIIGDYVLHWNESDERFNLYKCLTAHFSSSGNAPPGAFWESQSESSSCHFEALNSCFELGDVCLIDDPPYGIGAALYLFKIDKSSCSLLGETYDNIYSYGGSVFSNIGNFTAPLWGIEEEYFEGNQVEGSNSGVYVCKIDHTSSIDDHPTTGVNWETYWRIITNCG